jgi:isopentenyl-diphosphate Delta-isomerase
MEYLDIVDENNVLTGEKRLRSEVHSQGLWHRTVHIYLFKIVDNEVSFLVHLRAKNKDLHPNCWDTRFGGHIKSEGSIEDGIRSELMEEVGLELERGSLIQGEVYKRDHSPNREFTHSFYYRFDGDIATLKFNDGEVQKIKWMDSEDIIESMTEEPEIWSGGTKGFVEILKVLKNQLEK